MRGLFAVCVSVSLVWVEGGMEGEFGGGSVSGQRKKKWQTFRFMRACALFVTQAKGRNL